MIHYTTNGRLTACGASTDYAVHTDEPELVAGSSCQECLDAAGEPLACPGGCGDEALPGESRCLRHALGERGAAPMTTKPDKHADEPTEVVESILQLVASHLDSGWSPVELAMELESVAATLRTNAAVLSGVLHQHDTGVLHQPNL